MFYKILAIAMAFFRGLATTILAHFVAFTAMPWAKIVCQFVGHVAGVLGVQ